MRSIRRLYISLGIALVSSVVPFNPSQTLIQNKRLSTPENADVHQAMEKRDLFCGLTQQGPIPETPTTSEDGFEIPSEPIVFTDEAGIAMKNSPVLSRIDNFDNWLNPVMKSGTEFALFTAIDKAAAGLFSSLPAQTVDVMVGQSGFSFSPATVNINVGDTVRWIFSSTNHTVNSGSPCTVDGSFCSPNDTNCNSNPTSGVNAVYTHTFSQAGTFPYFCRIHCLSGMTGTVVVSSCAYSISPSSLNFAAAGGSDSVSVTTASGCAWMATSNDTWITITGGASGTGNGTVNYSVAANTGPARSGTMTIAGQTFTVTQSAPLRIDSVTPAAGRASGGQQITLTGTFDGLSSVTIGGSSVSWSYTSGTSVIAFTSPSHAVGAVDIVLTPGSGSPYTKANAFAFLPTTFTDNTLVAGVTTAKAQHIIELRQAVDALRAVAGLGPAPWTDPTLSPFSATIKAIHILELRSFLEDAASRLGFAPGSYTDPGLTTGFVIKRIHIEDLRQRIRNIAG